MVSCISGTDVSSLTAAQTWKFACSCNLKILNVHDHLVLICSVMVLLSFLVSCQGKADGNYKDPNNCYGYISCSNGITYHMPCPAELKYNKQTDRCDWPDNVTC